MTSDASICRLSAAVADAADSGGSDIFVEYTAAAAVVARRKLAKREFAADYLRTKRRRIKIGQFMAVVVVVAMAQKRHETTSMAANF